MDPKILLIDIETAPDVAYVWGVYDTNAIEIKEHWYVLSAAWSWYGRNKIECKALPDYHKYKAQSGEDFLLVNEIRDLLSEADIVIAHNGADFDVKKLTARFIYWGIDPPSPFKVVDTKHDLARVAKFSSNRLEWLAKQFGFGDKGEPRDFSLWKACMEGDLKAWAKMKKYNSNDIVLLRSLYDEIAPYISQPNVGLWRQGIRCINPICGSVNLQRRSVQHAMTRTYQRYQCQDCGAWTRDTKVVAQATQTRA